MRKYPGNWTAVNLHMDARTFVKQYTRSSNSLHTSEKHCNATNTVWADAVRTCSDMHIVKINANKFEQFDGHWETDKTAVELKTHVALELLRLWVPPAT